MTPALLDVNVLIALADEEHVHHAHAVDGLQEHGAAGWASCPLTQNGCLRILTQPSYTKPLSWPQAWAVVQALVDSPRHTFWPDDLSLLDDKHFRRDHIHGHRQLTDIYLLALAVHRGGRFVTFDTAVALSTVRGAQSKHLVRLLA